MDKPQVTSTDKQPEIMSEKSWEAICERTVDSERAKQLFPKGKTDDEAFAAMVGIVVDAAKPLPSGERDPRKESDADTALQLMLAHEALQRGVKIAKPERMVELVTGVIEGCRQRPINGNFFVNVMDKSYLLLQSRHALASEELVTLLENTQKEIIDYSLVLYCSTFEVGQAKGLAQDIINGKAPPEIDRSLKFGASAEEMTKQKKAGITRDQVQGLQEKVQEYELSM